MSWIVVMLCYDVMFYYWCGKLGLKLFLIFFGFWYNFGEDILYDFKWDIVWIVFDFGIMYFDFVNNYGFFLGLVEIVFGELL